MENDNTHGGGGDTALDFLQMEYPPASYENDKKTSDIVEDSSLFMISNKEDFIQLVSSCFENAFAFFFDWIPHVITLYFINNHATKEESAGFGLGLVWANCFSQGIFFGFSCGFQTLAAHAYGAGNHELVGILYQRTLFIVGVMLIPIMLIMINTESLLSYFVSDAELCHHVATYSFYGIPGLIFSSINFQFTGSFYKMILPSYCVSQLSYQLLVVASEIQDIEAIKYENINVK